MGGWGEAELCARGAGALAAGKRAPMLPPPPAHPPCAAHRGATFRPAPTLAPPAPSCLTFTGVSHPLPPFFLAYLVSLVSSCGGGGGATRRRLCPPAATRAHNPPTMHPPTCAPGTELYPRLGKHFDLKTFTNCRMGMMSWAVSGEYRGGGRARAWPCPLLPCPSWCTRDITCWPLRVGALPCPARPLTHTHPLMHPPTSCLPPPRCCRSATQPSSTTPPATSPTACWSAWRCWRSTSSRCVWVGGGCAGWVCAAAERPLALMHPPACIVPRSTTPPPPPPPAPLAPAPFSSSCGRLATGAAWTSLTIAPGSTSAGAAWCARGGGGGVGGWPLPLNRAHTPLARLLFSLLALLGAAPVPAGNTAPPLSLTPLPPPPPTRFVCLLKRCGCLLSTLVP